jgi:hypothetical protein
MADPTRAIAASVTGAVIGGIAGYLLMTEHGRTARRQLEQTFLDLSRELHDLRRLVEETATVLVETWATVRTVGGLRTGPQPFQTHRRASAY